MSYPLAKAALGYAFFTNTFFNSHKPSWQVGTTLPIFQRGELTLRSTPWRCGVRPGAVLALDWWMLKCMFFSVCFPVHSEDFSDKETQVYCSWFSPSCLDCLLWNRLPSLTLATSLFRGKKKVPYKLSTWQLYFHYFICIPDLLRGHSL